MKRSLTRAVVAAFALAATVAAPAGAATDSTDEQPGLPRGMSGVDGEISRIYLAVLDRSPDSSGLAYWTDQRQDGVPLAAVVGSFRTSPEFQQRFASMLDAPVDMWVETMYQRVLGRSSDAAGKAYWTDLVTSGVSSREALIIHFADSVEYRIATGTGPEGFADQVEKSRARYAALGDDYSYRVDFDTPFGFGWTTALTVADGSVTGRRYERWHRDAGARVVDDAWTETGADLGSHADGASVHTVDDVHDACRTHLSTLAQPQFELVLSLDDDGLMTLCGGFDPRIPDIPGEVVSINAFAAAD